MRWTGSNATGASGKRASIAWTSICSNCKERRKTNRKGKTMAGKSSAVQATTDREIVITRVLDAPRELVFKAWTDPQHVVHWWGAERFYYHDSRDGREARRRLAAHHARARRHRLSQ